MAVWQGVREDRGIAFAGLGVVALGAYGFVATLQPDATSGRVVASYGGVFAGSLLWGRLVDGYKPDRFDISGAAICLVGVAVITYAPRAKCPLDGAPGLAAAWAARYAGSFMRLARYSAAPRF